MSGLVNTENRAGVAVLMVDNPPLNALTQAVRAGLIAAMEAACADPAIRAIVIRGAGQSFPAGLPADELGTSQAAPDMRALCSRVEDAEKPVVAALHGSALGAGFALALAAHYRVAAATARIGLPEATLGLVPAGGATQRLARLAGAEAALTLMINGRPLPAGAAEAAALLDVVTPGDPLDEALALIAGLPVGPAAVRRSRDARQGFADPLAYQAELAACAKRLDGTVEEAPRAILRCVEAAQILPFATGLEFEADLVESCRDSAQSAALRHVYFAERRIGRIPEAARGAARAVARVGLIGGGIAAELAVVVLDGGLDAVLSGDEARAGAASVADIYTRAAARGRLTEAQKADRLARLQAVPDLAGLQGCDVVIECAPHPAARRAADLARAAQAAGPGAALVTTGPCGELERIARDTGAPGRVLGLRFMAPAHVMRLVELVVPPGAEATPVLTVQRLMTRLGRYAIHSAPRDMPLAATVHLGLQAMCLALTDRGVHPYAIDAVLRDYGMVAGAFQAMDFDGLGQIRRRLAATGAAPLTVLDAMISAGYGGRAEGRGFLRYASGQTPAPDPGLSSILAAIRPNREMAEPDILALCLAAMANAGARLVRERQALRPSDLDVAMIFGYGFPRLAGGPMEAADLAGLFAVQRQLERFADVAGAHWLPDPLIRDLVKNGRRFGDLNRDADMPGGRAAP